MHRVLKRCLVTGGHSMAIDVSREPVEPDYSELETSVRNWLAAARAAGAAASSGLADDLDVPSPR